MPWLKWTDGQTHDITILSSAPVESFVHWTASGSMPCAGPNCQYCAVAGRPRHRWAVEVRTQDQQFTWEMSNTVYTNLCAISHKLKAFAGLQISVTRNGTGLQTTYLLIPTGTVDVSTLPPIQPASTNVTPFGAAVATEQLRSAQAIAETIKALCESTGLNSKDEYAAWITGPGTEYLNATPEIQLERFLDFLEDATAQPKTQPAPPVTAESLL